MRRALLIAALVAGVLAPLAGSPYRAPQLDVQRLAAQIEAEQDHVTAVELAQWIRDRKPGLRVLDLRTPAEFEQYHVPSSVNVPLPQLVAQQFARGDTLVLVSEGGGHAAQGWVLMRARGYASVFFLRGGIQEWDEDVIRAPEQKELSRYFGGDRRGGC
ncbi:MAG TPA: rhodanese-like domain-containing protein [Thermoanaerobaculia bacterium]|nr:rhodanese-like domain-containing protein [Thermoanaerobaculia bacterium]